MSGQRQDSQVMIPNNAYYIILAPVGWCPPQDGLEMVGRRNETGVARWHGRGGSAESERCPGAMTINRRGCQNKKDI